MSNSLNAKIVGFGLKKKSFIIFLQFFFSFYLIFFFYLSFGNITLSSITISSLLYSTGKFCGFVGLLFLSAIIISGDIARSLDKFLGMDTIILFQRRFAIVTSLFVLAHPIFFILSRGNFATYIIPNFTYLPLALGIMSAYLFIIIFTASLLSKRISYDLWQYIHILTYILFLTSMYHFYNISYVSNNLLLIILSAFLFIAFILGVLYRTHYKLKQKSNIFLVKRIIPETKDVFTLVLSPKQKFSFKAGQFCFLRLKQKGLYARHPFTISSSPENKDLHFTICLRGIFTKALSELNKGDEVKVDGPFGIFTRIKYRPLVFIAGGIGITPFMSMLDSINASRQKKHEVTLFYSSKKKESIIFKKRIDKIKGKWFKKIYCITDSSSNSTKYHSGRIGKKLLKQHLLKQKDSIYYICGPESLKQSIIKILNELGVEKENILIDDFFW